MPATPGLGRLGAAPSRGRHGGAIAIRRTLSRVDDAARTGGSGYSGTPLSRKLGIKPGHRVVVSRAPDGFALDGVRTVTRVSGTADVLLEFHTRRAELARRLPKLRAAMDPAAGLWIAWPKRTAKVDTDLTEDVVRELAYANRLVDNKVCAIDETWSGLRLVIRLADR